MKNRKFYVRFVLEKSRKNKQDQCPIRCRMTLDGERKVFSTGEFTKMVYWNAKRQEVLDLDKNAHTINIKLELIKEKLRSKFLSHQLTGENFDVEDIYLAFTGSSKREKVYIIKYFRQYLDKIKKLVGKDLELGTWKKYNYACLQAEMFIKWKYKRKDYPIESLKLQFIRDFEYYLRTVRDQNQTTINKTLQRFRKPIREALIEGVLLRDPFAGHKPKRVQKQVIFLLREELEVLEKHQFIQPRLQMVKDMFIFCCYTGLPYIDMKNLKPVNIELGPDGVKWIRILRKKTKKQIGVPLLDKAADLLESLRFYDRGELPTISNQKFNSYLKEIADIVGIDKRLTHHTARKTFASTVLLFNDIPMEIVSRILGHSSIKITEEYYGKIVDKNICHHFKLLEEKL